MDQMSCHAVHYIDHDRRSDGTGQIGGYIKESEPVQSKRSLGKR